MIVTTPGPYVTSRRPAVCTSAQRRCGRSASAGSACAAGCTLAEPRQRAIHRSSRVCSHDPAGPDTISSLRQHSRGTVMYLPQGAPQELESIRILIVAFAVMTVVFWRAVLRITLTVAAIVIFVLLTSGAVAFFQAIHPFHKVGGLPVGAYACTP